MSVKIDVYCDENWFEPNGEAKASGTGWAKRRLKPPTWLARRAQSVPFMEKRNHDLYKKAGAKYFVSMGVHHDNFDMWNSQYQPRWNAAASGPKKDIVGIWKQAARKRGLRFGVSEHLSNSIDWYALADGSDYDRTHGGTPRHRGSSITVHTRTKKS